MIYVFIFRSDIEEEKDLHSMQIDVQLSGKTVGALSPSAAYCSTTNTELSILWHAPFCCKKVSTFSEGNKFSLERYLLEKLASGRATGKLLLFVVGITIAIFLDLKARCLIEICSENYGPVGF